MNVYFAGIGGVGIGPLAEIAQDAGYYVAGSDQTQSPLTQQLETKGVAVDYTQDGAFLQQTHQLHPLDWFIHTAALPDDHPELVKARELGIKIGKRDELISAIIEQHNLKLVAVAGTHGKTTTTGMLIWVLKQLNIPVSYSVGSRLNFGPSGHFDPEAEYFVYECDEFDRNFLHFKPYLSIITSVGYDHPDTYPTETDYLAAFQQFISRSEHTIMWNSDTTNLQTNPANTWLINPAEIQPLQLIGDHNRRNGTLVVKACEYLKLTSTEKIISTLNAFPGTARRFERLDTNLYSDYGHHPAEIAATLQLASELSDNITLVYQPHQNTRQHQVAGDYTDCMAVASKIIWLPTYLTREDPNLSILQPDQLTQNLINRSAVEYMDLNDDLWAAVQRERQTGRLVVLMGAGNIDPWARSQLAKSY